MILYILKEIKLDWQTETIPAPFIKCLKNVIVCFDRLPNIDQFRFPHLMTIIRSKH